jgi:TonB family protein
MLRIFFFSLLAFSALGVVAQASDEPVLKSYGSPVYDRGARSMHVESTVTVEFVIDDQGRAIPVSLMNDYSGFGNEAKDFVRTWSFEMGVTARDPERRYRTTIDYRLISGQPDPGKDARPTVRSNTFHYFEATAIAGGVEITKCPKLAERNVPSRVLPGDFAEISRPGELTGYAARVYADGLVEFNQLEQGENARNQTLTTHIEAKKARSLLERFRTPDFWSFCGDYSANITDGEPITIKVRIGRRVRSISDYMDSAPQAVRDLGLAIDETANSYQWRQGDPAKQTIFTINESRWLPKPGMAPLMKAAALGRCYELKTLIGAGSNVREVDASGWSALLYAAGSNDLEAVRMLLRAGADPNQSSLRGDTPLMAAALDFGWNEDLVKAGANVNAQNRDGQTALMLLAGAQGYSYGRDLPSEIRKALQEGADPSLKDRKGRAALDYLILSSCGMVPNWDLAVDTRNVSGNKECSLQHHAELDSEKREAEELLGASTTQVEQPLR